MTELAKALRPFAAEYRKRSHLAPGPDIDDWPAGENSLTFGDLRRASEALTAYDKTEGGGPVFVESNEFGDYLEAHKKSLADWRERALTPSYAGREKMMAERLRALVILDEVGSNNPLGREAADLIDAQAAEINRLWYEISLRNGVVSEAREQRDAFYVRTANAEAESTALAAEVEHLADQCSILLRENEALAAEVKTLREALEKIANGEGYYGMQAREYKEIARSALQQKATP